MIEVEHPGAFITRKQYELFEEGSINNVPVMIGFNSEEEIVLLTGEMRYFIKYTWFSISVLVLHF